MFRTLTAAFAWTLFGLSAASAQPPADTETDTMDSLPELERTLDAIRSRTPVATQNQLIETFVSAVKRDGSPLILDDSRVAFVYRGPGERVRVTGDLTQWSSEHNLSRVGSSDLFVGVATLPSDARIEYLVCVDDRVVRDPLCPYHILNGIGGNSELAMPAYEHYPLFTGKLRRGAVGGYDRVTRHTLDSKPLGYEKEIHLYRPPDGEPDMRCPTVYLHDGRDYIEYAHTPALLDHLITTGQIQPINAVFISPPHRHQAEMPNRTTEYGLNPDYVTFVADELVPYVDHHLATQTAACQRLTVGDSYAGLVSASIVHARPDLFGLAYSQSGYVSCQSDHIIEAFREKPSEPIRLYVDVGIYERTVGKGWLPDEEIDFLEGNRRFRDVLTERDYDVVYREYPEGHTWGNWRRHLADALVHFFGTAP